MWPAVYSVGMAVFGHKEVPQSEFIKSLSTLKSHCNILNKYLQGKSYIVGDRPTVADIVVASPLVIAFQTVLDGGFRKGFQHITEWF